MDCERPDLESINILEFERLVKLFAHPANYGKVNIGQLKAAFEETGIFESLDNPYSVTYKLFASPFFNEFTLTHSKKSTTYQDAMAKHYITSTTESGVDGKEVSNKGPENSKIITAIQEDITMLDGVQPKPRVGQKLGQMEKESQRRCPQLTDYGTNGNATGNSIVDPSLYVVKPIVSPVLKAWISVDALLLFGCLHCGGLDSEKAQVFTRVVAPELDDMIYYKDKDLHMSMLFLITAATILEQMICDIVQNPRETVVYENYQLKIDNYKPTLKRIYKDFDQAVFGQLYNRRPRATFIEMLSHDGWKYFSLKNLNELFALKCSEYQPELYEAQQK